MNIYNVLERAWKGGFSTKSDFARKHANEVAVCASLGYITTKEKPKTFSNVWRITNPGLEILNECYP